ncbi:peptide chain release factor N(5)-glutamine methyltransferase [Falsihalocynthiibacter sp. SS001]|uniref:peptide chain release factor N(5)-glutamine methyltransferase n=1 Tax=Falsihalocynthiibacter sp. SS001 TaxID=3349698 RepID=UPI0036D367D7
MTGAVALARAVATLKGAGIESAATDARILLADALGVDRARLMLLTQDPLTNEAARKFESSIDARAQFQPVSQIIGYREFYGRRFTVTPDVLDPRPDTELLIDVALQEPFGSVLDLGTGTGCILLTLLAQSQAAGLATDISDAALSVARRNAEALDLESRAQFLKSDWFAAVSPQRFDAIVSNPPYISSEAMERLAPDVREWEPHLALTPGGDGLGPYVVLTQKAPQYLAPDGRLIVEIGYDQGPQVAKMFRDAGFSDVAIAQDISGHDRVVSGKLKQKLT